MITQARLKEVLDYDPETGVFTWKARPITKPIDKTVNTKYAGKRAGNLNKVLGYVFIYVDNTNYSAHRLAYLFMMGRWPAAEVDHKDNSRANNKWSNLRDATRGQQAANMRLMSNSANGLKGIFLHKRRLHQNKPWSARICVKGVKKSLGYFPSKEEAHAAYVAAARKFFGEFANAGAA